MTYSKDEIVLPQQSSHSTVLRKPDAILIAVSDGFGGYGDFLFALKLSEQLKMKYADSRAEVPPIYLISQPTGKATIERLKGHIEFNIEVLTPAELKKAIDEEIISVATLIEAPVFKSEFIDNIDAALANSGNKIQLIMIPEYGYNSEHERSHIESHRKYRRTTCKHLIYADTVYSGFKIDAGEAGILVSETLIHPAPVEKLISQLDNKIREPVLKNSDWMNYKRTTELSMQYSHDIYTKMRGERPCDCFLTIHREFYKSSIKNQDVLMIGKSELSKREALWSIKDKLIADDFTRICFLNADNGQEDILHDSGIAGKTYRVIYASSMSHVSMLACNALSGPLGGATGDQSLSEALSSNKLMVYECLNHKKNLIENYDAAMRVKSNNDPDIVETLRLLRTMSSTQYLDLGTRLRNPIIQEKLQRYNQDILKQYDFASQVIKAEKAWELAQAKKIVDLLHQGKQQAAIDVIVTYKNHFFINDLFENKSFLHHAIDNNPEGDFVKYCFSMHVNRSGTTLQILDSPEKITSFFNQFDCLSIVNGATLFAQTIKSRFYEASEYIIQKAIKDNNKQPLCEALQRKCATGETYLANLRQNWPATNHEITARASLLSTINRLDKYKPKKGSKREIMHESFKELAKTFTDISVYNDAALIGLLLLNKKNIASEYHWLSPKKNIFFGSKLYSICEDALKDLGVDLKNMTLEEERHYYKALESSINTQPNIPRNQYILQTLSKQAGITFPPIKTLLPKDDAKAILEQRTPIKDSRILSTSKGVYQLNPIPIGQGGWGSVYSAYHYSLVNKQVTISQPLAIKKMSRQHSAMLEKEQQLFQKAYPDQHFERFETKKYSYLAMPLFSGVQLDKYLCSHPNLSIQERQLMAIGLLTDLLHLHQTGITHNNLKPQNILYDPINKSIHIIDFGCAQDLSKMETMHYQDVDTSVFAFEFPPEYLAGTTANPALDIYSLTPIIAELLGVNKRELVQKRLNKVLPDIDEPLRNLIQQAFNNSDTLGDALFTNRLYPHVNEEPFQKFVQHYVTEAYDFTDYQDQLGAKIIALLNTMQAKDPKDRPHAQACIEQLRLAIPAAQEEHTAYWKQQVQEWPRERADEYDTNNHDRRRK